MTGMSLEELRQQINMFSADIIKWIHKVGVSTFNKFLLSPQDYVNTLVEGTAVFDELAFLIAARVLNIHVVVSLAERYWSTKANVSHEICHVKLAFSVDYSIKEITSKKAVDFDKVFRKIYRELD